MTDANSILDEMNDRSREVFRRVVEGYLENGEPVGSRTLTRSFSEKISAATIRNVMQDLEFLGLLGSPHTSAGRVPTQLGLRMFVDGLLEVSDLNEDDRVKLDMSTSRNAGADVGDMLDSISAALSGVTQGASLVLAPKQEAPIKHIEFVALAPDRALVVLVTEDGNVENRMFNPPLGQTPSSMREAANFLNSIVSGHTISDLRRVVERHVERHQRDLDQLSQQMIKDGIAVWAKDQETEARLIVRGRSNLLDDGQTDEDMERIKSLFDDLEQKKDISQFLDLAEQGEGVKIFIGSENKLFSLSGSSLVVSPYMNADRKVIGAVGVIGPKRLNYGRVVPIVDYTAQLIGRILRT